MRRAARGVLLLEVMVSFSLLALVSVMLFNLLSVSDLGYSQSTEARMALRLAQETLERARGASLKPTAGVQTLTPVAARSARGAVTFTPELQGSDQGTWWLVTSRVRWGKHLVELTSCVAK